MHGQCVDLASRLHCPTRAHCQTCRDPARSAWRQRLTGLPDFPCPAGLPIGWRRPASQPAVTRDPELASALAAASSAQGIAGTLCRALIAQLQACQSRRHPGRCRDRRSYSARLRSKILYYATQYAAWPP